MFITGCFGVALSQRRCESKSILCLLQVCRIDISDFLSVPEPTVYVPVNKETSLYCEHSAGVEGWYKNNTLIHIENGISTVPCDCVSMVEWPGIRLTFNVVTMKKSTRDGEYGCWANTPNGFEQCYFTVVVAGEFLVYLVQAV